MAISVSKIQTGPVSTNGLSINSPRHVLQAYAFPALYGLGFVFADAHQANFLSSQGDAGRLRGDLSLQIPNRSSKHQRLVHQQSSPCAAGRCLSGALWLKLKPGDVQAASVGQGLVRQPLIQYTEQGIRINKNPSFRCDGLALWIY